MSWNHFFMGKLVLYKNVQFYRLWEISIPFGAGRFLTWQNSKHLFLPIFWVRCSRSLPQTTKNHLNNKVYQTVQCIQLETKSPNVYKTQMQPNRQQLMLPEEWRGMRSVNCPAFQTAPPYQCLLIQCAACFLHQLPASRGFNWELCISALQKLLSCRYCVHSYLSKNFPQILLHWLTAGYHTKSNKDKGLSYSCRGIQQLWHRVHYTDQHKLGFFSELRLQ